METNEACVYAFFAGMYEEYARELREGYDQVLSDTIKRSHGAWAAGVRALKRVHQLETELANVCRERDELAAMQLASDHVDPQRY